MHAEAGNRAKVPLESLDSTHQVHTWTPSSTRPGCHVQLKGGGCTQCAFIHWWLNHTSDTLYSQPAEVYPFYVCVQWEWGWGAPQRIFQAKHAWFLLMSL